MTLIDNSRGLSSLLTKQAEEFSWTMKGVLDMYGGEADRVVVVGYGRLESISRARLSLAVLLCCHDEVSRKDYNRYAAGYRAAIEQGLVEVALPPWHPQVKLNFLLKEPIHSKRLKQMFADLQIASHLTSSWWWCWC